MTEATSPSTHYAQAKARIIDLVTAPDVNLDAPVPACPDWVVRDLIAHMIGVPADFVNGRMENAPSPQWTAVQVAARRGRSLAELLAEWDEQTDAIAPVLESPMGMNLICDAAVHEQDLRGALGEVGERENPIITTASGLLLGRLRAAIERGDAPALRVVIDGEANILGDGEPAGELRASAFELLRSTSGRRTPDQVRALFTSGDPDLWIEHFFVFGPRTTPLIE
ncbi:MAG TPA: maleylpyruvate isomerase family mycothiol-dependent enzyme [Thermomicrobiales bacterium]|nr:maleylpyruvate isomerase family mycothiol-dependent enzyme [Thermomicrobiales bacterium]